MPFQGKSRFNADQGTGFRGGPADFGSGATPPQRGGWNSEQNPAADPQQVLSSAPAGNPHSSAGFRRALEKTQRTSGSLKDQLPNKATFAGKGFRKPNYFAQGGARHGMHMGSGAPAVSPAQSEGADFGSD